MPRMYDFTATGIDGAPTPLSRFAGEVTLVVNVASKCGFTPQYRGLQQLYARYGDAGFVVLGFPCNQFAGQEPGSSETIAAFCSREYQVSFPMFQRIDVNGPHAHPLYAWLKQSVPGVLGTGAIKWNFTKFLIDRTGQPVVRYAPTMAPDNIAPAIERLLKHEGQRNGAEGAAVAGGQG